MVLPIIPFPSSVQNVTTVKKANHILVYYYENNFNLADPLKGSQEPQGFVDLSLRIIVVDYTSLCPFIYLFAYWCYPLFPSLLSLKYAI